MALGVTYPSVGHMHRPHYPHHPGHQVHHPGHQVHHPGYIHHPAHPHAQMPGFIPGPPPPPPYSPSPYPGHHGPRYPYIQTRKIKDFQLTELK